MNKEDIPKGFVWCKIKQHLVPRSMSVKGALACKKCYAKKSRNDRLIKTYGITTEQYDLILEGQGGRCAICLCQPKSKRFHLDHDHQSGLIRGVLCGRCNHKLLGGAKESVEILKRATEYLLSPPAPALIGMKKAPAKKKKGGKL